MMRYDAKTMTRGEERANPGIKYWGSGSNELVGNFSQSKLWIRTAAGPLIGFGHLRRCLVLAGMLASRTQSLFLLDPEDTWSAGQIVQAGWQHVMFSRNGEWSNLAQPNAILVDTRLEHGLDCLLEEARRRGIPVASIHDLGLCPLPADVVIDGSLSPDVSVFPRKDSLFFVGPSYMVLDPSFEVAHGQARLFRDRIQSIAINLGGGDSRSLLGKIMEGLRLWGRDLEVTGFRGFSGASPQLGIAHSWHPVRFRWGRDEEKVSHILCEADLAITAGGLSSFEALCAGTPLLAVSHDRYQQITIRRLADEKACIDLGLAEELECSRLPEMLESIDADRNRRMALSRQGRRIVDGGGAKRVAHIIGDLISGNSGARPSSS